MLDSVQAGEKPSTEEVNTTGLAVTDDTVRVGILHSLTGTMAISETGSVQAEQLAIKQINEQGGVLGRQIEYIVEDGASDWPTFAEKARKLLEEDDVASVFGAWTSASRKAVLPVFEQNNGLLYYPTFYEGLEQSENVIYTGQEATQQILAALDWVAETHGAETFYLVGSDYIWPRTSMKIARTHIERDLGGEVVGEDYYPLGNTQFGSLINKIKLRKPDLVFAAVVGGSNVAWFKQLNAAGMTPERMPMLTISVTEDEVLGIGKQNVAGFWSSMKYFQSLDIPANNDFVAAFRAEYGEDAVIGDVTESAYLGPWLWKRAVEKAGSFDVSRVTAASAGLEWQEGLPHGYTRLMPNHHLSMRTRIGEWQPDGQARVIFESEIIEPNPFPEGY
nr:urea ABC transporter substrate-binding protein [Kushneria aurantia]